MITFILEQGYDAARSIEIVSIVPDVGDAKTLIIHPASTTHQQLTDEEQEAAGVTDDLVRLSVGLESADDVIADLNQAVGRATT